MIHNNLLAYLVLAAFLFAMGLFGLLQRRSLIGILIATELLLNAANINLLAFGHFTAGDKALGQIYAIFVIALAAAEVAIGLSLVIALHRRHRSVNIEKRSELKG